MIEQSCVLFDLDGTLTDPKMGITKSVAYALKHFDIEVADLDSLCPFIGPPLYESFPKYFGLSKEETLVAVAKYREYFSVTGKFENEVYEGIPELLEALKQAGKKLLVATSKPHVFAVEILQYFGLLDYFVFVAGSELDGYRVQKDEVIAYALRQGGITDVSQVLMIGDREYDILGAKKAGVSAVGVLYGYGSSEELETAAAETVVSSVAELHTLLLG